MKGINEAMNEGERVHFLSEGIYKNLLDNFNPGVRQLISTGRTYQKALHTVATAAKVYIDCIYSLAQSAQVCKGSTSDIGAALLQIAEVHKEINTQVIDNIKSFHAELLIPLETKQENEFKQTSLIHKKYIAGHKYHSGPVDKAQSALKKHRKKSKAAKYGFDQKEFQHNREVKDAQMRLDEYRIQSLRQALLEERKCYCFLLDRICAMVRNYASHHSKAHELLTHRLPEWSDACKHSQILPQASEGVIQSFKINQEDVYNNPDDEVGRGGGDFEQQGSGQDSGSIMYGTSAPPSLNYGTAGPMMHEDPYATRGQVIPNPPPQSRPQARAMYNHQAHSDTQLSFMEGDIIALIGDKRDGWHYGENLSTHRMGWYPLAFTSPIDGKQMHKRTHSLGNLAELATPPRVQGEPPRGGTYDPNDPNQMGTLQRSHTITERPLSMYASRQDIKDNKLSSADRTVTWAALDVSTQSDGSRSYADNNPYYTTVYSQYPGSVPDVSRMQGHQGQQGHQGHQGQQQHYHTPPPMSMPPLPLPPPPPPQMDPPTPSHHNRLPHPHNNAMGNPNMAPPPPPPHHHQNNADYGHIGQLTAQGVVSSGGGGPYPAPSPPQSSSGYSGSSNRANGPSSNSSFSNYGQSGFPPPPPPPPLAPPPPPTSDYEEEPPRGAQYIPRPPQGPLPPRPQPSQQGRPPMTIPQQNYHHHHQQQQQQLPENYYSR